MEVDPGGNRAPDREPCEPNMIRQGPELRGQAACVPRRGKEGLVAPLARSKIPEFVQQILMRLFSVGGNQGPVRGDSSEELNDQEHIL